MAWSIAPQRWPETVQRVITHPRTASAVTALLALTLGWQIGALAWRVVPPAPAAAPPKQPVVRDTRAGGDAGEAGAGASARLASLELFGAAPDSGGDDASVDAAADAPETQLDLTLKGVYAPGSGDGLAIISAGGGPEAVYAVGDTIQGDARITGIFADRVVLRRNGRAETLRMAGKEGSGVASDSGQTREADGRQREIAQRARELRRDLLENPGKLARMVRFQPYVQNGNLVGYRIQPRGADAELLRELGLRPSDVVTRVNGRRLSDPREANKALRGLRDAERIRLTLLRDGQRKTLSVSLGAPGG